MHKPLVIGITGAFGSGKTTAAIFFEKKGFKKITLSKFLEEELRHNNRKVSRKNLQDLGNNQRAKFGREILASKALEGINLEKAEKSVIDGIRNIGEIEFLRENVNFVLLGIVCDKKVRFERIKVLENRERLTFELFEQIDFRDLGIEGDDLGQQGAKCLALSDYFVDSNEGYESLYQDLEKFLGKI